MFIRQLEYIVTLAREQHFARAAQACHVSQPALSSAIRHLEDELGVTIVQRGRRFIGFTEDGEKVLGWARQTLASLAGMRQDASAARQSLSGTLRIGAIPTTMPVAALIAEPCRMAHPEIRFAIYSLSTESISRQLDEYQLDVGLTYLEDRALDGFATLPLFHERYVLLSRKREAPKKPIGWDAAAALPLCLLTPNMQNRRFINGAFRRAGVQPNVVLETDSLFALYAQVAQGGLHSVMPHSLLAFFGLGEQVSATALVPELTRNIGLIARDQPAMAPIAGSIWPIAETLKLQRRFDTFMRRVVAGAPRR